MSTRILNTIPNLLAAAAVTSLREVFQPLTASQTPAVTEPSLADLGLPKLTFTVTARRVRGVPLTIPAGRYLLTVIGDPPSASAPGGVMLLQLPGGTTLDDAMTAAEEARDEPPAFYNRSIMPGGAEIGDDGVSETVVDLVPGEWIVAGYAMTTEPTTMTVTGALPERLPEPRADATVLIGDESLALRAGRLRAGRNTIRIDNTGERPHVVSIARVQRGTPAASIDASPRARTGREPATAPVDPAGIVPITSTADQSGGTTMWLSLDLAPGTYIVFGDTPDPKAGAPRDGAVLRTAFTVAYAREAATAR